MSDQNNIYKRINNYNSNYYKRSYQDRPNFSLVSQPQTVPTIKYDQNGNTKNLFPKHNNIVDETSSSVKLLSNNVEQGLSIKEEPNVVYTKSYNRYVQICSNDRNTTTYPSTNFFKGCFEKIKNVVEIELISAILPNQGTILDEPFLIIEIDELPSNIEFSCKNIQKAFALLPMKKPNKDTASFIIPELGQNYKTSMKFKTPLASIQSFTVSIKDLSGNLFNFGADTVPPTKSLQTTFMFKITALESDMSPINVRAIF